MQRASRNTTVLSEQLPILHSNATIVRDGERMHSTSVPNQFHLSTHSTFSLLRQAHALTCSHSSLTVLCEPFSYASSAFLRYTAPFLILSHSCLFPYFYDCSFVTYLPTITPTHITYSMYFCDSHHLSFPSQLLVNCFFYSRSRTARTQPYCILNCTLYCSSLYATAALFPLTIHFCCFMPLHLRSTLLRYCTS